MQESNRDVNCAAGMRGVKKRVLEGAAAAAAAA
jgi:hypothetical protein